jgi:hypothetical protein
MKPRNPFEVVAVIQWKYKGLWFHWYTETAAYHSWKLICLRYDGSSRESTVGKENGWLSFGWYSYTSWRLHSGPSAEGATEKERGRDRDRHRRYSLNEVSILLSDQRVWINSDSRRYYLVGTNKWRKIDHLTTLSQLQNLCSILW